MEQRLSLITIAVDDVAATRAFFEDGLGWSASPGPSGEIAFYQTGGSAFAVYSRAALETELGQKVPAHTLGGVTLAWNARSETEVDDTFKQAVDCGARPVKQPTKAFWGGYSSYVEIPGGHLLEIAHNPFWPIGPDGSIQLPG